MENKKGFNTPTLVMGILAGFLFGIILVVGSQRILSQGYFVAGYNPPTAYFVTYGDISGFGTPTCITSLRNVQTNQFLNSTQIADIENILFSPIFSKPICLR